ncbi:hypothetical protein R6P33_08380, partial [Actinotignum timonense]|nr:hypothetical protein [Actinotignum timonense]
TTNHNPLTRPNTRENLKTQKVARLRPDSWFSHLAVEVPGTDTSNEWLEPVSNAEYARLTARG